ncbi:hypothetical protein [Phormidesmis priestleyi]
MTGAIEFDIVPANVFRAGENGWTVPTLSQADINARPLTKEILD